MVITALHNLVQMLEYGVEVIMKTTSKFMQACQVLELVDLPYDAMESQKRFINEVIQRMNADRAYEALIGDVIERIGKPLRRLKLTLNQSFINLYMHDKNYLGIHNLVYSLQLQIPPPYDQRSAGVLY
jgi:hypothetical protein